MISNHTFAKTVRDLGLAVDGATVVAGWNFLAYGPGRSVNASR